MDDGCSNGINGAGNSLVMTGSLTISPNNNLSTATSQCQGYSPVSAKGHKGSVYALAMNEGGALLVSGGIEKVQCDVGFHFLRSNFSRPLLNYCVNFIS